MRQEAVEHKQVPNIEPLVKALALMAELVSEHIKTVMQHTMVATTDKEGIEVATDKLASETSLTTIKIESSKDHNFVD